jgi:hypothetical protein
LPGFDINDYTYSGFVAVTPLPIAYDFVDRFPLSIDPANPAHWTGAASDGQHGDGQDDGRWTSRPGTYHFGVEAFAKPDGHYCTTDAATGTINCPQAAFAEVRETPLHEVVVVPRLDAAHAKPAG